MIVYELCTCRELAVGVGVVTPRQNSGARNFVWQKIPQPEHIVVCRPSVFSMAIQAVDGDDAATMSMV